MSSSSSSSSDEEPVTVIELLSPFSGSGTDLNEPLRTPQNNLQDELLVDISDIQPAGDNKDLFSIDEDSREGTPSKSSEFQVVELTDETLAESCSDPHDHDSHGGSQLSNHHPFNPSAGSGGFPPPPPLTRRRSSDGGSSNMSEVSGLFPIYEVPGVSFTAPPQSDLESLGSEWEDSGGGSPLERLSKDTVYQAFLRMRQRYHKYKGRYTDLLRVFREKERETEKLREVLTKQQDKALRRMSELREQCTLEQQAKAHLEQELRSDLEEKDHKIEALQTKVRLLQDGCFGEGPLKSLTEGGSKVSHDDGGGSGAPSLQGELTPVGKGPSHEDFDTVSVGSLGSISTAPPSLESEELIEKLREDLTKHKTLLARCMENIRSNKERIASLLQERDSAQSQLQEKCKAIDTLKNDHERMLESLRATVESSALTMAETKQRLFEELQTKEAEVERYRDMNQRLQKDVDRLQEECSSSKSGAAPEEDVEIDLSDASAQALRAENAAAAASELETKCVELENLVGDLQEAKKRLELELERVCKGERGSPPDDAVGVNGDRGNDERLKKEAKGKEPEEESASNEEGISVARKGEEGDERVMLEAATQASFEEEEEDIEQLTAELRNLNEENESLNAEVSGLNDENEALHGEFQRLRGDYEDLQARWTEEVEKWKELRETRAALEATLREEKDARERLEEKEEALKKDKKVLQEEKTLLEKEKERLQGVISLLEEDKRALADEKERLQDEKKCLEKEKGELEVRSTHLGTEKESLEKEKLICENEMRALKETIVLLEDSKTILEKERESLGEGQRKLAEEMVILERDKEAFRSENAALQQQTAGLTMDNQRLQQEKEKLDEEKERLEKENGKLGKERERLEKENLELSKERGRLEQENEELSEEKRRLEEENEELSNENERLKDENGELGSERERLKKANVELGRIREEAQIKADAENRSLIESLKEKEDKVKDLEGQLRTLEEQLTSSKTLSLDRDSAIHSLEAKLEALDAEIRRLSQSQKEAERALGESDELRKRLEEDLKETERKLSKEAEDKAELEDTVRAIEASLENIDNLSVEEGDLRSKMEAIVSYKGALESKIQFLSGQAKELEEQLALTALELERQTVALREATDEKDVLRASIQQLELDLSSKSEELRQSVEDSGKDLLKLRSTLVESENLKSALEKEVAALSLSVEAAKEDAETQRKERDALVLSLHQLKEVAESLENENTILKAQLDRVEAEKEDLAGRLEKTLANSDRLTKAKEAEWSLETERNRTRIDELTRKATEAEEQLQEVLKEKEDLEKMVDDAEAKVSELEEIHLTKAQKVEEEWQKKIRLQHLSDSFLITGRSLALCNMIRVSCELERLQAEQDQRLTKASLESSASEGALRRDLDRKDAELARLMDARDAAEALLEEQREELQGRKDECDRLKAEAEDLRAQVTATETRMARQILEVEASNADLRHRIEALQNEFDCIERLAKEEAAIKELAAKEAQQRHEMQLQVSLLTKKMEEMKEEEKKRATQITILEKDKEALKKEIDVQVASRQELQHHVDALKEETKSTTTRLLEKLEEERSRCATLLQESESWGLEKEALVSEVNGLKVERTSLCSNLERARKTMETLTVQSKELSDRLKHQQEVNERLKSPSGPRKDFIASLEAELKQERSQLSSLKDALRGFLEEDVHVTVTGDEDIRKALDTVRSSYRTLLHRAEGAESEKAQLQLDLTEGVEDLKRRDDNLKAKEQHIKKLTKELNEAKDGIEALSEKAKEAPAVADKFTQASIIIIPEVAENGSEMAENDKPESPPEAAGISRELEEKHAAQVKALETKLKEQEEVWRARVAEGARQKEMEMRLELETLTAKWSVEKKELERLARMAADAFRSGTDSVDLLKEQVAVQRKEIDELRRSHKREIGELQALLEVKRRRGKTTPFGEVRGAGALEEAAEFEYLRNILYQYMMGKETQTLSKVLCAVVKFSKDQQRQIVEAEDRKQNLLREERLKRRLEARARASGAP